MRLIKKQCLDTGRGGFSLHEGCSPAAVLLVDARNQQLANQSVADEALRDRQGTAGASTAAAKQQRNLTGG